MKVICLLEKTYSDVEVPDNTYLLVYRYEDIDGYNGQGQAIAVTSNKRFFKMDLGHCSCYGPWENKWVEISSDSLFSEDVINDNDSNIVEAIEKELKNDN